MGIVDYLTSVVSRAGHWGYVVVFVAAAAECAAFLGVLVPGELLVVFGGFLASRAVFDLDVLIMIVAAGAIVGDSIGYELGRRLGRAWLLHYGRPIGVRQVHLDRADRFFERHGGKTIFVGRFVGFLRAFAPFVAGSSRMPYARFLAYNVSGAALWAAAFTVLGYLAGESWRSAERWVGRASALLGGLIALIAVLTWLWRRLTRDEEAIRHRWRALLSGPRVTALHGRFEPQLRFLQARFTPGGYLGLHLTAGMVVLVLACWLFGGIVEDLISQDPLVFVDKSLALWLHAHATPGATSVATAITFLGSAAFISGAVSTAALVLIGRRSWYHLLALTVTMAGGELLNILLKQLFHRPRPFFMVPLASESGFSFPSGHVMGATLFYGLIAYIVARAVPWRWGTLTVLAASGLVILVAASRIYLGVHYLSDTIGAFAAGIAWLALCVTGVETVERYRRGDSR